MAHHDAACDMPAKWVHMGPCDDILAHIVPTLDQIGHMATWPYGPILGHMAIGAAIMPHGVLSRDSPGTPRALVVHYKY